CRRHLRESHYIGNVLRKYEDIVCEILFIGSEAECLSAELLYRPNPQIGWNCVSGGGMPPSRKGCRQNVGNQNALGHRDNEEQLAAKSARSKGNVYAKGCKHSKSAN